MANNHYVLAVGLTGINVFNPNAKYPPVRYVFDTHFAREGMRYSNLPKVTQLVSSGSRICTWTVWFCSPPYNQTVLQRRLKAKFLL